MDTHELRHGLGRLSNTLRWLRTLPPDGIRYKVWLGDLVEFVGEAYGAESPQMARIRAVLTSTRLPAEADDSERTRRYLERLDTFEHLLTELGRGARDPIIFFDPSRNGGSEDGFSGPA